MKVQMQDCKILALSCPVVTLLMIRIIYDMIDMYKEGGIQKYA
jgi:hypothetical protein